MTTDFYVSECLAWLRTEIDIHEKYHNHKETMAWTATAFYLPGIIGLAYLAGQVRFGLLGQVAFSVLIGLLTGAVLGFVSMQYRMRFEASDITEGIRRGITLACCTTY